MYVYVHIIPLIILIGRFTHSFLIIHITNTVDRRSVTVLRQGASWGNIWRRRCGSSSSAKTSWANVPLTWTCPRNNAWVIGYGCFLCEDIGFFGFIENWANKTRDELDDPFPSTELSWQNPVPPKKKYSSCLEAGFLWWTRSCRIHIDRYIYIYIYICFNI